MGFFDDTAGLPGLSWDGMPRGTTITGVVVPDGDGKAYVESHQTDIDTGEVLTFKDGSPRPQAVLTLATDLTGWQHVSDKFADKVKDDPDAEDVGLRKIYVRGKALPKLFKGALKAVKAKDIVAGMTVSVRFVGKKPIPDSQFKENVFEVSIALPTPASLEKMAQHADGGGSFSTSSGDDGDDDAPPF